MSWHSSLTKTEDSGLNHQTYHQSQEHSTSSSSHHQRSMSSSGSKQPSGESSTLRSNNHLNSSSFKHPSNGCSFASSNTNNNSNLNNSNNSSNNYTSCFLSSSPSSSSSSSLPSSYSSFFAAAAAVHGYQSHHHHQAGSNAVPSGSTPSFMTTPLSSSILYPHLYSGLPASNTSSNHLTAGNVAGHSGGNCSDTTASSFFPASCSSLMDASSLGSVWRPYWTWQTSQSPHSMQLVSKKQSYQSLFCE